MLFYLSLVFKTVFSDKFQFLVEASLLERSPGSWVSLPIVLGKFSVDHFVPQARFCKLSLLMLKKIKKTNYRRLIDWKFCSHVASFTSVWMPTAELGKSWISSNVGKAPANQTPTLSNLRGIHRRLPEPGISRQRGETFIQCRLS